MARHRVVAFVLGTAQRPVRVAGAVLQPAQAQAFRRIEQPDRGAVRAGAYADLVLFDPATVIDTADFDAPTRVADGILETWVNGQSAYVWGQGATPTRAGRLVSRNAA